MEVYSIIYYTLNIFKEVSKYLIWSCSHCSSFSMHACIYCSLLLKSLFELLIYLFIRVKRYIKLIYSDVDIGLK